MVCTRSRAAAAEAPATPKPKAAAPVVPLFTPPAHHESYERCRDERIRSNLEKMQKLGIFDLGLKIKAAKRPYMKNPNHGKNSTQPPSRRSSRLQGVPSVCYSEGRGGMQVLENCVADDEVKGDARKYNATAHVQIRKGKRIYDNINGKTCHQCRQKTLCSHAICSRCVGVQGQFCGGCLRARYGEQVHEAIENPNWICPVCRGICNCSFCRLKKGFTPTGQLFYKVANLGFKSVAHYLTKTKAARPGSVAPDGASSVPVKRTLAFAENLSELKVEESQSSSSEASSVPVKRTLAFAENLFKIKVEENRSSVSEASSGLTGD